LVSLGADVNAVDRFGDSPLEMAESHRNEAAAKLLTEFGARRIRGDEAQRRRVIEEQLRE
jgi:ankyrin repeat protein